jgi:hypothetical protein
VAVVLHEHQSLGCVSSQTAQRVSRKQLACLHALSMGLSSQKPMEMPVEAMSFCPNGQAPRAQTALFSREHSSNFQPTGPRSTFMKFPHALGLTIFGISLIGCAAPEQQAEKAPREQAEYVTGSNIPRKDRSSVKQVDAEALSQDLKRTTGGSGATAPGR